MAPEAEQDGGGAGEEPRTVAVHFVHGHGFLIVSRRFTQALAPACGLVLGALTQFGTLELWLVLVPTLAGLVISFPHDVDLDVRLKPGALRGGWGLTLRARDVLALTTARLQDGVKVAFAVHHRTAGPILFEVGSDQDADAITSSLGAGQAGAGAAVPLLGRQGHPLATLASFGSAVLAGLTLVNATAAWPAAIVLFALSMVAVTASFEQGGIRLHRDLVRLGERRIPYGDIVSAATEAGSLVVSTRDGLVHRHLPLGLDKAELDHVVAHLMTASTRAHGTSVFKPTIPAVLDLGRASAAEWLSALDAAAATIGHGGDYREVALDVDDLGAILRDGDLALLVRAAAARVLVRAGGERDPIAHELATFRGENGTTFARLVAGLDAGEPDELVAAIEGLALSDREALVASDEDADVDEQRARDEKRTTNL